jgi:hypothetical protein
MTGGWLTDIARVLLHEDTFDLMVAPAIADLQFDTTPAAYVTVWTSLAGALGDDFVGDVRFVTEDIGTVLGLVIIQASYYTSMLLLLVAGMSARDIFESLANGVTLQLVAAAVLVFGASTIPTLLCCWPPRRVRALPD